MIDNAKAKAKAEELFAWIADQPKVGTGLETLRGIAEAAQKALEMAYEAGHEDGRWSLANEITEQCDRVREGWKNGPA